MRVSCVRLLCHVRMLPSTQKYINSRISQTCQSTSIVCTTRCFQTYPVLRTGSNKNQDDTNDDEDSGRKRTSPNPNEGRVTTQAFANSEQKTKEAFHNMIDIYVELHPNKRGLVEFIYAAMKHMEEFEVQHDLATYKKLIELMPEGKYVPTNIFQEEFVHYPKQQDCIVNLLDKMESKGVCPDEEMERMLKARFGRRGHPVRKVWRMLYWMPKMKNITPWPVPLPPPKDPFILAKLAIERITSVDPQSEVSVSHTDTVPEAIDHTFIVSGQSPTQRKILDDHPRDEPIYVEGAFRIWLRSACVNYFILRADKRNLPPPPEDPDDVSNFKIPFFRHKEEQTEVAKKLSVHEQEDGTILAVCASGSSSRDSLLSWIRLLEKNGNPALAEIPVVFTLKSPLGEVVPLDDGPRPPPPEPEPEKVTAF